MKINNIKIFDTTLRDGEQSPGASMNTEEKIQIALQLQKLGVDVIEAGFAAASKGDFDAIDKIASIVDKSTVCSLSRAVENDIKQAGNAISKAKYKRIHTFIATSPIHMQYKLKMKPDEVVKKAINAVSYAKTFTQDVEFSLEDACRSEISFMKEITEAALEAGATTINLPDTVGYLLPAEIYDMINQMSEFIKGRAIVSLHNHNDLGLAVANTLSGIQAGAMQVECTINGLGERAGNASLEEIVMALKTRSDIFGEYKTNINTKEIYPTSRLVSNITGIIPQPNKAIVGKNAFAHESGIHQDGVLKYKGTYEIMKSEDIGLNHNSLILGKHSGRHAFKKRVQELGYTLNDEEINEAFLKFKNLSDKKKEMFDDDIRAIVTREITKIEEVYKLVSMQLSDCSGGVPTAAISIEYKDKIIKDAAIGDGTIDALFKTVDRISMIHGELVDYKVDAVSKGKDALARVVVKVKFEDCKMPVMGHGLSIDTMQASAKAYVGALNSYISMKK